MEYEKLISRAAAEMRPSGIRKFFDIAAEMKDCISLGVGEPDFKTPWAIRQAGIQSLEKGRTWYTSNSGLKELRQEICRYLERRFDLHYTEDQTLVTVGGSEAIDMCIRALVEPGDEVIIPEPCFVLSLIHILPRKKQRSIPRRGARPVHRGRCRSYKAPRPALPMWKRPHKEFAGAWPILLRLPARCEAL